MSRQKNSIASSFGSQSIEPVKTRCRGRTGPGDTGAKNARVDAGRDDVRRLPDRAGYSLENVRGRRPRRRARGRSGECPPLEAEHPAVLCLEKRRRSGLACVSA